MLKENPGPYSPVFERNDRLLVKDGNGAELELWASMAARDLIAVDRAHYESLKKAAAINSRMLEALKELFADVHTGKMTCKDNATLVRLHAAIAEAEYPEPKYLCPNCGEENATLKSNAYTCPDCAQEWLADHE
jgi:predicted RNA-binding Zn-ribbon protein involved in translation (DUF1610 family)